MHNLNRANDTGTHNASSLRRFATLIAGPERFFQRPRPRPRQLSRAVPSCTERASNTQTVG
ncbi:hypothetical protein CHLRE_09g403330v5 [Chlamydomonas reinhardtii]|uniref:Uncharacterized protein n=1 Tax=Chlamydomonas reinhardtii TaxID=3055 RepID=A0A2K3DF87_CHLRE|nr:uncharacterized protein CHLRE_09g403330v5 [Chlamydomonas reinhardtii]PNW79177.1 hypothetical protein CHLRE_09g403330v5 [Chlamydomonas reinhardtii]